MSSAPNNNRPAWAKWLDSFFHPLLPVLGRIFSRPSDATLHELSGRHGGIIPESDTIRAQSHIQKGRTAFEQGALGESLHHFASAIAIDDNAHWAWHGRGDALQLSERYVEALAAYDQACVLQPDCGLHHAGRYNALSAQNRTEEAEAAWSEAIRLDDSLSWIRDGKS